MRGGKFGGKTVNVGLCWSVCVCPLIYPYTVGGRAPRNKQDDGTFRVLFHAHHSVTSQHDFTLYAYSLCLSYSSVSPFPCDTHQKSARCTLRVVFDLTAVMKEAAEIT